MTVLTAAAVASMPAHGALAATGSWQGTGSMGIPHSQASAVLLTGPGCAGECGKLLVIGGVYGTSDAITRTAELYDPETGTWARTGDLNLPRTRSTATLLTGPNCGSECGEVLAVGGYGTNPDGSSNPESSLTSELYDPATGRWTLTAGRLTTSRVGHTSTQLLDGEVLVAGGTGPTAITSSELYDPLTGTWRGTRGTMSNPRSDHVAALLGPGACGANCGKVLVAGGCLDNGPLPVGLCSPVDTAELYDPSTETWSRVTDGPGAGGLSATRLLDGQVLVVGGHVSVRFDPVTASWLPTAPMNDFRSYATQTLLPTGRVLAAGGITHGASSSVTDSAEVFDPASGLWTITGSMAVPRWQHIAALLPTGCGAGDGLVVVAGGRTDPDPTVPPTRSAELYVPLPKITAVNPIRGLSSGGTNVTVTGVGFSTTRSVSFGGTRATTFTVLSDTRLTVVTPPHTAGTVDVTVTTPDGTSPTCPADQFTYFDQPPIVSLPPAITAIAPSGGPTAGGTPVTITGTGFEKYGPVTAVRFGDGPAAGFRVVSDTQISSAMSPPHGPGSVDLTVTTTAGTSAITPADVFTFVEPVAPPLTVQPPPVAHPPPAQPPTTPVKPAAPPGSPPAVGRPVVPPGPGPAPANVVAPAQAPATGHAPGGVSVLAPGAAAPVAPAGQGNPLANAVLDTVREARREAAAEYAMTRGDDEEWLPYAAAVMGAGFASGFAWRSVARRRVCPSPSWARVIFDRDATL